MYIKEFDIVLDIKNSTEQEPFEVVQGDSQSNLLNISMTNGLEPYDLTGTTAEIVFYKSDSTTVQQTQKTGVVILNAPDGKIQCTLKTNTIACPGKVVAEVRVLSDEVLLTSARFEFYVRKSLINDKTIESTDEFPVLTQLMQDTSTLIDQVNQIEKQVPENVVSRIDAMESDKVDKTDIVQTDTISDASKVPSSVVTNKLSSQVTELNKNIMSANGLNMTAYGVHPLMYLGRVTDLDTLDNKYNLKLDFAYCCFDQFLNALIIGYNRSTGYAAQFKISHIGTPRYRAEQAGAWSEWVQL